MIVFTGLLSMFCLGRKLNARQWAGIVFVIIGLAIVGVSDFLLPSDEEYDTSNVILGESIPAR